MKDFRNNSNGDDHRIPSVDEITALMQQDSILPEHITAAGLTRQGLGDVENVLLTGVTGTLGPYILLELSNRPLLKEIHCLIRTRDGESAEDRLHKTLSKSGVLSKVNLAKVKTVEGDIGQAKFGMSVKTWSHYCETIDAIFHVAASVNHVQDYVESESETHVRNVNVRGTKNALEFASTIKLKFVFFASTFLMNTQTDKTGLKYSESWPVIEDYQGWTTCGYPLTKFVSEMLLKAAIDRGIPCKSFRFPIITGESKSGRCVVAKNHLMLRCIHFIMTGMQPRNQNPVLLVPVDKCANLSVTLFFNEQAESDVYNITHHEPHCDDDFAGFAKKLGYNIRVVEEEEFLKKFFEESEKSPLARAFKNFYRGDNFIRQFARTPAVRKWVEGVPEFFVSPKVAKLAPEYYKNLEPTFNYLERDLKFAWKEGLFKNCNL